jgi:hypothetical protein
MSLATNVSIDLSDNDSNNESGADGAAPPTGLLTVDGDQVQVDGDDVQVS